MDFITHQLLLISLLDSIDFNSVDSEHGSATKIAVLHGAPTKAWIKIIQLDFQNLAPEDRREAFPGPWIYFGRHILALMNQAIQCVSLSSL